MPDITLPPLPEPQGEMPYAPPNTRLWYKVPAWSRDQMASFAREAVMADRRLTIERCAKVADDMLGCDGIDIAAAIRSLRE